MSFCATWLRSNLQSGRQSTAISSKAIEDKKFQEEVERDESLNFLLRDTISLTMMGGSEQTNVIPSEAWANLDVRILPGGDPKALLAEVRRVVNDPNVTVEPWTGEFRVANYSGTDNALFAAIREVSAKYFPGTPVVPHITSGYTENQRYRPLGMDCVRVQSLYRDRGGREYRARK